MGIAAAGTFAIAGEHTVHRLGFGAMRLCGPMVWGYPEDRQNAGVVLRRALELGIDFIDTADAYGPEVNEYQIRDCLAPYPPGLLIATKGGLHRGPPEAWPTDGRPAMCREPRPQQGCGACTILTCVPGAVERVGQSVVCGCLVTVAEPIPTVPYWQCTEDRLKHS